MAKKSAKSKGYRKAVEKKPYLSKRDIVMLCVLLAAVLLGAILLFTYDDGALKVKDGKIVDTGENWLIVNGSTNGRRYFKLAEMEELTGYTMEPTEVLSDENLHSFRYTPEEAGAVTAITVTANAAKPDRAASYYRSLFTALTPGEITEGQIGGQDCSYFTYQSSYYAPEGEENAEAAEAESAETEDADEAPNHFEQALHAYFPAAHDFCVGIGVQVNAESEDGFLTDEQLTDIAAQALSSVKFEEK